MKSFSEGSYRVLVFSSLCVNKKKQKSYVLEDIHMYVSEQIFQGCFVLRVYTCELYQRRENAQSFCKHSEKSSSTLAMCKWSAHIFTMERWLVIQKAHTEPKTLQDSKTRFFPICLCNMNNFMCQLIPASFHKSLKNLSFLHMNSSPYVASNCLSRHGRSSLVCLHIWEKGFKYCSQQQKVADIPLFSGRNEQDMLCRCNSQSYVLDTNANSKCILTTVN